MQEIANGTTSYLGEGEVQVRDEQVIAQREEHVQGRRGMVVMMPNEEHEFSVKG